MSELTKEQIKGPDRFQRFSKKVVDWAEKNKQIVIGAIGLFMVAGVVYAGYDMYCQRVEDKARLALYDAQKFAGDAEEKLQAKKAQEEEAKKPADQKKKEAEAKKADKTAAAEPTPAPVTQNQIDELKGNALTAYAKVLKDFPGTASAHIAAIQSSQMFLEAKKLDEASKVFEGAKEPSSRQGILLGAYLSQKGKVLAEKGDYEGAVREWEKVIGNPSLTAWHGDVLVKAGIGYEKLNKKDKAIELYKKASNEFAETDAGRAAKKFLILAERPEPKG